MTAATQTATSPATAKPKSVFAVRDFKLLWIGEAVSALGDQFAMVALPWLALLMTGSAIALGTVLAVMAIPRAVFMLIGGAYVDRLSPRRVMQTSNAVRLVAVTALGVIVVAGQEQLWMLYAFALVFGIADAFFYPAQTAIVPELVDGDQLQQANGITQGTTQFTVLVGPALAGIAIVVLGATGATPGQSGVALALLLDAVTFLISLLTLALIRPRATTGEEHGSVVQQIAEGVRFVVKMPTLLIVMAFSMCANLLITGPFEVGIPVLAYSRLPEGAAAFGLLLSAFGGGSLLGMLAATVLRPPPPAIAGSFMFAMLSIAGVGLAALAFTNSTIVAMVIAVLIGAVLGYTNISFITWVQRRIPRVLMGRVMSLLMFGSISLVPISIAVAGILVEISLDGVLMVAGVGMAVLALAGLLSRHVRQMGLIPVLDEENEQVEEQRASEPEVAAAG